MSAEHRPGIVAAHEWGHRLVGEARGAIVHVTSVIPYGNVLGYNLITPNPSKSIEEQQMDLLVSLSGGEAAEEALGHTDHSGCGSDRFKRWRIAENLSRFIYHGKVAAGELYSWGLSTARSYVNNFGIHHLKDRALFLQQKQVVF